MIEAVKYNVLPLDDRRIERFNSDLAGRPVLVTGNSQILYSGMGRLSENSVLNLNLKNKSHSVTAEIVVPEGGGLGNGGTVTLFIDGEKVGEGPIAATVPMLYSGDETCDVGYDSGTPVSDDYTSQDCKFNGTVKWVQLDAGDDNHDHLITPEERLRVATAIQ